MPVGLPETGRLVEEAGIPAAAAVEAARRAQSEPMPA
jgi:hypothetical protein